MPRLPPLAECVVVVEVGVWGVLCASWMYATSCTQWPRLVITASSHSRLLLTVRLCGESPRPVTCPCDCACCDCAWVSEWAVLFSSRLSSTGTRYGSVVVEWAPFEEPPPPPAEEPVPYCPVVE